MLGGCHDLPPITGRPEAPPSGSLSGLMEEGINSSALVNVLGLIGHSNMGPRTESHWPDLGRMCLIPNPINCYLEGWG